MKTIEEATLVELIEAHQDTQSFGERPRGSHATWIVRNEVGWAVRDKARAMEDKQSRLVEALVHALTYYVPSTSAEAEVLSYLNGYTGEEDIMGGLGLYEKLNARTESVS